MMSMMADLLGVPMWIIKSKQELAKEKQDSQQQMMMEQMMQAGPALGQTVKNSADGLKSLAETAQIGIQGQGTI